MGNNCVGSRLLKEDGFIQSVSRSLWWRSPDMISYNNKETSSKVAPSAAKELDAPQHVQNKPPELVMIVKEETKPAQPIRPEPVKMVNEETKPAQPARPEPVKIVKEEIKPPQPRRPEPVKMVEEHKETKPAQPTRPEPVKSLKDEPKAAEPPRPRKPHNVKRMASAGLQAESVLRTKTGHLKQYYNLGRKLGHGQFGTTFLCVEKGTGKEYACKSIAKRKLLTEDDVDDVRREIEIMHHLSGHPNVISIKGAYEDAVAVHVVMELCTGSELFERIVKRGHYTERKAAELARTIFSVIEACHSLGVMHRDLKPENFLFVNQQEDSPLKTIDFGLSVFFKPGEIFTDVVGSPYYVAPEVLCKRYGPQADVWSAGVIIYILLSGVPPFWAESEQEIFEEVLHGDLDFSSDPWPNISESAKDLVRKMLVRDPKKRLTAHEVLCHPWVRDVGVAPDKPLDPAVISRLTQFSAMNKLKKMALRVIAGCLSDEEIAGLKEMFKMLDTDNSGQITFEELKAGLKRYGANLNESEIYDLMQAADVDSSGTIDYGEFIAATLHLNKIEREDHLFAAFSYFDKDGSGYITQDELQQACVFTREALLEDMFSNAKTTAGRLHLAKELLNVPVEALKSFAGTKEGLSTLNSWILDSMGKDGTQLLRHCVRLLVLVSTDLLAVRLSGIGKTVKEKVCVHTSRDIRAIASQLVNMWIEVFRKEKASNGGLKLLRQSTAVDSLRYKSLASGKPPLRVHHGPPDNKGSSQISAFAGSHLPPSANVRRVNVKPVKLETGTDSKLEVKSSRSQGSVGREDAKGEDHDFIMSEEEQAAFAAAEAARAAALAAAEAYASSEAKCNTSLPLPKILSFHKFARREQYPQMDESDIRRKWSGGALGRQDCISEIDSRNCRVRDWSVDFSAACINLDNSKMSVDNLSQRSHSNEIGQLNFREQSAESVAVDSSIFTKAWVDADGSVGVKDYNAIDRWQSQAAAAESDFFHRTMQIRHKEDSNMNSKLPSCKREQLANESSVSQVTVNKELVGNQPRGAERIKQAVVDYVASLLMPLYKAKKIDKEGYKSIMKKTATKVMEQTTDAEKAMAVYEFLDFKRKNKIRSFVDKLIERHMAMKPGVKP